MQSATQTAVVSTKGIWAGRFLSGLAVLFLVFDGVIKFTRLDVVTKAFDQLGYPPALAASIGALLLTCTAVYVIPRTSVLGAILLTGYLGGAIASHARVGNPLFSHVLFPTYIGAMIWGGLYLRNPRLRALLPLTGGKEHF